MKKLFLPALLGATMLVGCSASKNVSTIDDVYYSAGKTRPDATVKNNVSNERYQSYWSSPDDEYLRMRVRNRNRWSTIDDAEYWYGYTPGCRCNASYNNYSAYNNWNTWNSWNRPWGWTDWAWSMNNYTYNPYMGYYGGGYQYYNPYNPYTWGRPVVIKNQNNTYTKSYRPNLGGYTSNSGYDRTYRTNNGRVSHDGRSGSGSSTNSQNYRSVFGDNNSGSATKSNTSWERPARSFGDGSGSSSSSSGSSSSSSSSGSSRSSSGSSSSSGGRGGRGGN